MKLQQLMDAMKLLPADSEVFASDEYSADEMQLLIPEFVEALYHMGNVAEIEQRVEEALQFEISDLNDAVASIEKANPQPFTIAGPTPHTFEPLKMLANIKSQIETIKENQRQFGVREILVRMEMLFDPDFNYILMALTEHPSALNQIESMVLKKLKNWKADDITFLWAKTLSLFEGEAWTSPLTNYPDITPRAFWKPGSSDLRKRCATFIVRYKPLIMKKMLSEGAKAFRIGTPGLARILVSKKPSPISNLDILVVRSISWLIARIEKIFPALDPKTIAKSFGHASDAFCFDGEYYHRFKRISVVGTDQKQRIDYLLRGMQRAMSYIVMVSEQRSPLPLTEELWRYKLGQEVLSADANSLESQHSKSERILEGELCKFLVEKGVRCYGKSLGRSEPDLYVNNGIGEDYVIETKVCKRASSFHHANRYATQLLSYMDQEDTARGVLAIYNLTDTLLIAPRRWLLNGRVFIVIINYCGASPSRRKHRAEIQEDLEAHRLLVIDSNAE